jgi:hypothetical protein
VPTIEKIKNLSSFGSFKGGWSDTENILSISRNNYHEWSARVMQAMSQCCQLQQYLGIDDTYIEKPVLGSRPTREELNSKVAWDFNNLQAKACLVTAIDPVEAREISGCVTAKEAWDILKRRHVKKTPVALYHMIEETFGIKITRSSDDFLASLERICTLANRIYAIGLPTREMWCHKELFDLFWSKTPI